MRTVQANRFGCPGWDIWLERAELERVRQELSAKLVFCDEECAEVFRIERGIPRWGRELTDQIIPTEANLEADVDRLFQGLLHRTGSDFANKDVRAKQQAPVRSGFDFRNAAPAWACGWCRTKATARKQAG